MPALINIIGNSYNDLTVIERSENINGRVAWKCLCKCGREKIVRTGDIVPGHVKNCGNCDNKFENNMYEFLNGYVKGYSKQGRHFFIDEEDLFKIKNKYITVDEKGYCSLSIKSKTVALHRFLMNPKKTEVIDHINRIPCDNRKMNLRTCSQQENLWNVSLSKNNKSGVTGVHWVKKERKWGSEIIHNGQKHYLGRFNTLESAVKARIEAEIKYFGEFRNKENGKQFIQ